MEGGRTHRTHRRFQVRTFGTRNARGDIVHTGQVGFGLGAGVEASFGGGVTGVTKLWTW
jgi:hypothetical protein